MGEPEDHQQQQRIEEAQSATDAYFGRRRERMERDFRPRRERMERERIERAQYTNDVGLKLNPSMKRLTLPRR